MNHRSYVSTIEARIAHLRDEIETAEIEMGSGEVPYALEIRYENLCRELEKLEILVLDIYGEPAPTMLT